MARPSLDEELLRAVRSAPNRRLAELEELVGSPRTNFGRPVTKGLRTALRRLVDDGLVEEDRGAYRISELGRRSLAEGAFGSRRRR
jgi:DNA-binding PadR family transcriptional regulator